MSLIGVIAVMWITACTVVFAVEMRVNWNCLNGRYGSVMQKKYAQIYQDLGWRTIVLDKARICFILPWVAWRFHVRGLRYIHDHATQDREVKDLSG